MNLGSGILGYVQVYISILYSYIIFLLIERGTAKASEWRQENMNISGNSPCNACISIPENSFKREKRRIVGFQIEWSKVGISRNRSEETNLGYGIFPYV
jgi:hypothetical protein